MFYGRNVNFCVNYSFIDHVNDQVYQILQGLNTLIHRLLFCICIMQAQRLACTEAELCAVCLGERRPEGHVCSQRGGERA